MITIDQATLAAIIASLLSLAFAYVPGLKDWFDKLAQQQKAITMAIVLVVVAVGLWAGGCASLVVVSIACTKEGGVDLLKILFAALTANQGTFVLLVNPFKK